LDESNNAVIGFHHTGVVVPDIDAAIRFYTELLDFEVYSEGSWDAENAGFNQVVGLDGSAARLCMLKGQNAYLELFEYVPVLEPARRECNANETGIRHLCFAVRDVQAMLARCIELGGSKINEPYSVPGGATAAYCRDPFGNLIELVAPGGRFPEPFTP
jgi:catechol 2,3-dioxygenase-like lactoylglutathione lyase family enzyme